MPTRLATLDDVPAIIALQRQIHGEHVAYDPRRWTIRDAPPDVVYEAWLRELLAEHEVKGLVLVATNDAGEPGGRGSRQAPGSERANADARSNKHEGSAGASPSQDQEVVGYLLSEVKSEASREWSPACVYVQDIYVAPEARRQGFARSLMTECITWANRTRPDLPVRLLTAGPNESGRAFFQSLGFRVCAVEMIKG